MQSNLICENKPIASPILFDMDGTLLDLAFDNYIWMQCVPELWAQQNTCDINEAKNQLYAFYLKYHGQLNWYSSKFWQQQLNIDVLALQYQYRQRIQARPFCFELLEALKKHDIECWLITNADQATLQLKLESIAIRPYFNKIISSESFGYCKEEQRFWHTLQQLHHFDPVTSVFIDDNYDVLHSAKQFGIKHLYSIQQPDSTQQRLDRNHEFEHLQQLTDLISILQLN